MRALFALTLLPLAGGCSLFTRGQPEGDWLFTVTELSSACDGVEDTNLDEAAQTLGSTMRLADGTYALSIDGLLLRGEADAEGYNLSTRDETRFTDEDCQSFSEGSSVVVRGLWGEDLLMQGRATVETWETYTECYGINEESRCTTDVRIEGMLLSSSGRDHLREGVGPSGVFSALGAGGGGYF